MSAEVTLVAWPNTVESRELLANQRDPVESSGAVDFLELGPDYTYVGLDLLLDYWRSPAALTRGRTVHTLVLLNLPDGEYRRQWRVRPGDGGKWGRTLPTPWPGGRRRERVARRQDVKRWLYRHQGGLIVAEVW